MYSIRSRFVNLLVTPSHTLYIAIGHYFPKRGYFFQTAENIYNRYYIWFKKP